MSTVYNSKLIDIIVNGRFLTGFRDGDVYNYTDGEDRYIPYLGSDGTTDYSEKPTNEATITVGLKHTSPSISFLDRLYNNKTAISLTVIDSNPSGKQRISGENGVIMRRPDSARGKAISEREYVFLLPDHKVQEI